MGCDGHRSATRRSSIGLIRFGALSDGQIDAKRSRGPEPPIDCDSDGAHVASPLKSQKKGQRASVRRLDSLSWLAAESLEWLSDRGSDDPLNRCTVSHTTASDGAARSSADS